MKNTTSSIRSFGLMENQKEDIKLSGGKASLKLQKQVIPLQLLFFMSEDRLAQDSVFIHNMREMLLL